MMKNQFAPAIGVSKGKTCPKCQKTFGARTLAIHIQSCQAKQLIDDLSQAKILSPKRQDSSSLERKQTMEPVSTNPIFKEEDMIR